MDKKILNALQSKLERIIDVCKGFAAPLDYFYKTKTGLDDLEPLVDKIISFAPKAIANDIPVYKSFYKTAISFLEASCNPEDKIFISIKTLADVMFAPEGEATTFSIMIDSEQPYKRTKTENIFFEICIKEYERLEKLLLPYDKEDFISNVSTTLERLLKSKKFNLKFDEFKKTRIESLMDFAYHEAIDTYFDVVGQKYE